MTITCYIIAWVQLLEFSFITVITITALHPCLWHTLWHFIEIQLTKRYISLIMSVSYICLRCVFVKVQHAATKCWTKRTDLESEPCYPCHPVPSGTQDAPDFVLRFTLHKKNKVTAVFMCVKCWNHKKSLWHLLIEGMLTKSLNTIAANNTTPSPQRKAPCGYTICVFTWRLVLDTSLYNITYCFGKTDISPFLTIYS